MSTPKPNDPDPLAFARSLPPDRAPSRSDSWAVALAERAYDAVLRAAIAEALAAHASDTEAAASLGMARAALARAARRYGLATKPGRAGRPAK